MSDLGGDAQKPGVRDIATTGSAGITKDAAGGKLANTELSAEQRRFIAQINRWLDPDSPDHPNPEGVLDVRFPNESTRRFIFVDSPDVDLRIGLFRNISGRDEHPVFGTPPDWKKNITPSVDVNWLNRTDRKAGIIHFHGGYRGQRDVLFEQEEVTGRFGEEGVDRWEREGGRIDSTTSPSRRDMIPDLTSVLEEGTYNDDITQAALRYFQDKRGAVRILPERDALSGQEESPPLPPAPEPKAIEQ